MQDLIRRESEAYWELCQTAKMDRFGQIANGYKPSAIVTKCSSLDVWQGSK